MFRPPFVIGDEKLVWEELKSRIFKEGEFLFFKIDDNNVRKIGQDYKFFIDFSNKSEVKPNGPGLVQYNGNMHLFDEGLITVDNDEFLKWNDSTIWVSSGRYSYLFQIGTLVDGKIPLFIPGSILSSFDVDTNSSVSFRTPIEAKLFFYGITSISEEQPKKFDKTTVKDVIIPNDKIVRDAGDIFFGALPPEKNTTVTSKKNTSEISSSNGVVANKNGFLTETETGDTGASGTLSGGAGYEAESGGEEPSGVDDDDAASDAEEPEEQPKEIFISLLPPKLVAPAAAPILLPDDTWVKIDARPFAARDLAGSLVLHTLAPDNYPFGAKVSMCFNCATELVLRFAPDLKKLGEFYNPTTGVERWNGRFVYKPETSLPLIDLKNDKTGVNPLTPEVWGTPPLENGVYVRKSIETPLELQILVIIDADAGEWIFGVLTR